MAQSQIRQPSQDELLRALMAGQTDFDPTLASKGVAAGEDLANTVLKNKQAQEDRVKALREKIELAKKQKDFANQVGGGDTALTSALNLDPAQGTRQFLEQKFTERAAKAPKIPNYVKAGETADEIIMVDQNNPRNEVRIKAPGVGAKSAGRGDPALALQTEKDRAKVIINKAKDALSAVGPFTTGVGSVLGKIPGTPARDLRGTVDTIKANLGFEQLAKMRQASPTGGALGQIAVKELEFLQAAVSNLETAQSEDQVRQNVKEVIARYQNWLDTTEGRNPSFPNGASDVPDGTTTPQNPANPAAKPGFRIIRRQPSGGQ